MNPGERAFNRAKQSKDQIPGEAEFEQEQEALGLGNNDTKLINERLAQDQQSPRREDFEFYQNQVEDAEQRAAASGQMSESDRRALEALQQVLHLNGVKSEQDQPFADPAQYADTLLQDKTAMVAPRADLEAPDPNTNPAQDAGLGNQAADPVGQAEIPNPAAPGAALFPQPDYEQNPNISPNLRAIAKRSQEKAMAEETSNAGGIAFGEAGQGPAGRSPFDTEFASGQEMSAQNQPENLPVAGAVEGAVASQPEAAILEASPAPADLPAQASTPQRARIKPDTRPWWAILPLLAIVLGVGGGIWYAFRGFNPGTAPDPSSAQNFFQSGTQQAKQGANVKAISDLDQAIRLNPNDPNGYVNRGIARFQNGNISGAIEDYNEALRLNPNLAVAWSNRSQAKVAQNNFDEAFSDASQAIQLNPNLFEAFLNRGNALFGKNNLDNALQDYQKAQQSQDPAIQSRAFNNIGNIYAARSDLDNAIKSYDQAITLVRSYADAFFNRAVALQRKNRTQEAIQGFRDAANLYQNQGKTEMYQRALGNAERLQRGTGSAPAGSPTPAPTTST